MSEPNFTASFTVDQTPQEVFAAINNVRGWWKGEIEGGTNTVGDTFTYRVKDIHRSVQKISELVPGQKVVWLVTDAQLDYTQDKTEWIGTTITFDIAKKGEKTEVRFTHVGLIPAFECFESCSTFWGSTINNNLRSLIAKGN